MLTYVSFPINYMISHCHHVAPYIPHILGGSLMIWFSTVNWRYFTAHIENQRYILEEDDNIHDYRKNEQVFRTMKYMQLASTVMTACIGYSAGYYWPVTLTFIVLIIVHSLLFDKPSCDDDYTPLFARL